MFASLHADVGRLIEVGIEGCFGVWLGQQVALCSLDSDRPKRFELRNGLDALCGDFHTQDLAEVHDRFNDRAVLWETAVERLDERLIDLEGVEWEFAQQPE